MRCIAFFALLLVATNAQEKYKLCVTDKVSTDTCYALQRGDSKVACLRVTDSADCAIRLERGEADFGVFNAEELLLAYQFYPNEITPIKQLRHADRIGEEFEFQSVAVISSSVNPVGSKDPFESIRNGGFCHPGFSASQWWNDYILKYFDRKVVPSECKANLTAIENEVENIKNFFGKACRPGEWTTEPVFDEILKQRYPELCELCDNKKSCSYANREAHGHIGALECLKSGRGKVAYAALTHVRNYFSANDSTYQFLCMDGRTQPLSTEVPCAWIKQPWSVIAARRPIASTLTASLEKWLTTYATESWTAALNTILQEDSVVTPVEETSTVVYLSKGRDVDLPNSQTCKSRPIRWCTISHLEQQKCRWVSKAAEALGIEPQVHCVKSNSTFQCFRDIAHNDADIMTIDSNYGHLARTVFGLRTVLYSETESDRNSVVVAVTRENSKNQIKNFDSLRGSRACFPEYGGIAWLSFVHVAKTNEYISSSSCNYPRLVANFFSGACTPGIRDNDHSNKTTLPEIIDVLCSSCQSKENNTCSASKDNAYYGDQGALECLKNGDGDVAFIETRNLKDVKIDPNEYRILCKNGTLSTSPGFNFDMYCPFSVTIDSEVVGRKNSSQVDTLDTVFALLKIENWLGYRASAHRPIRIYEKFNNTLDLLFKDSSTGLVNVSSTLQTVIAYQDLFRHVETCSMAPLSVIANLGLIALVACSTILFSRVL